MSLLQKLFRRPAESQPQPAASLEGPAREPLIVSASFTGRAEEEGAPRGSAAEGEETQAEFEEFCATFCHRPGTNLMEFLAAEGITGLQAWLDWRNPNPLPKAFVRLALATMRRGENVWDQEGVSMFWGRREGWPGEPPSETLEALSVLAQVLGKPLKIYFRQPPDGQMMVKRFEP